MEWLEAGEIPTLDILKSHSLEVRNLWAQVPTVRAFVGWYSCSKTIKRPTCTIGRTALHAEKII